MIKSDTKKMTLLRIAIFMVLSLGIVMPLHAELTDASVVPANTKTGTTGIVTVSVTLDVSVSTQVSFGTRVTFPAGFDVSGATLISSSFGGAITDISGQEVTVTVFADYGSYAPDAKIVVFDNIINPTTATASTMTKVEVLFNGFRYNDTQATVPEITANLASVVPTSVFVGATGNATVDFSASALSAGSFLEVTFPAGFDVSGVGSSVSSSNFTAGIVTTVGQVVRVLIVNAIESTDLNVVLTGIMNPTIETAATTTTIETKDSSNVVVDTTNLATVPLISSIPHATVVPANVNVAITGNVTVNFTAASALSAGSFLEVTFPAGFDVSGVGSSVSSSSFTAGIVTAVDQVVRVPIESAIASSTASDVVLTGITNPSNIAAATTTTIETKDSSNVVVDRTALATVSEITITAATVEARAAANRPRGSHGGHSGRCLISECQNTSMMLIMLVLPFLLFSLERRKSMKKLFYIVILLLLTNFIDQINPVYAEHNPYQECWIGYGGDDDNDHIYTNAGWMNFVRVRADGSEQSLGSICVPFNPVSDKRNEDADGLVSELVSLLEEKKTGTGWVRRRRFELLREGHKQENIEAIIEKERQDKKNEKVHLSLVEKVENLFGEKGISATDSAQRQIVQVLNEVAQLSNVNKSRSFNQKMTQRALPMVRKKFKDVSEEALLIVAERWSVWFLTGDDEMLKSVLVDARGKWLRIKAQKIEREKIRKTNKHLFDVVDQELFANKVFKHDSQYREVFERELKITKEVIDLPKADGEAKSKKLRINWFNKFVVSTKLINQKDNDLIGRVGKLWKDVYYGGMDKGYTLIADLKYETFENRYKEGEKKVKDFVSKTALAEDQKISVLETELRILKQIVEYPYIGRKKIAHLLHVVEADEAIRYDGIGILDIYKNKRQRELILADVTNAWESWMYQPNLEKRLKLRHCRDKAEFKYLRKKVTDSLEQPSFKGTNKNLISNLTKIFGLVDKAIDSYQKSDFNNERKSNKKILSNFDREINSYHKKKMFKEKMALINVKKRFLKWGICPITHNERVDDSVRNAKKKKMKLFKRFYKIFASTNERVVNGLERELEKNSPYANGITKVLIRYQKDRAQYTELGNYFPDAVIYIANPFTAIVGKLEFIIDGKKVDYSEFKPNNDIKAEHNLGIKFLVKAYRVPLRVGQKIHIKTFNRHDRIYVDSITGQLVKTGFLCQITLIPKRKFMFSQDGVFEGFDPKRPQEWEKEKDMKIKSLKMIEEMFSFVTHKDGTKSVNYGLPVDSRNQSYSYFTTTILEENFTLTNIPLE